MDHGDAIKIKTEPNNYEDEDSKVNMLLNNDINEMYINEEFIIKEEYTVEDTFTNNNSKEAYKQDQDNEMEELEDKPNIVKQETHMELATKDGGYKIPKSPLLPNVSKLQGNIAKDILTIKS